MNLFLTKLILSLLVGGILITLTTILADKYGSKIGGWIGGLPSTVVISLFFIGLAQSSEAAIEATTVIPVAQGFTGLFMVSYSYFSGKGFYTGLILYLTG